MYTVSAVNLAKIHKWVFEISYKKWLHAATQTDRQARPSTWSAAALWLAADSLKWIILPSVTDLWCFCCWRVALVADGRIDEFLENSDIHCESKTCHSTFVHTLCLKTVPTFKLIAYVAMTTLTIFWCRSAINFLILCVNRFRVFLTKIINCVTSSVMILTLIVIHHPIRFTLLTQKTIFSTKSFHHRKLVPNGLNLINFLTCFWFRLLTGFSVFDFCIRYFLVFYYVR